MDFAGSSTTWCSFRAKIRVEASQQKRVMAGRITTLPGAAREIVKEARPVIEKVEKKLGEIFRKKPKLDVDPQKKRRGVKQAKINGVLTFQKAQAIVDQVLLGIGDPSVTSDPKKLSDYLKKDFFDDVEELVLGTDKEALRNLIVKKFKEALLSQKHPRKRETALINRRL